jgi:hypothetical protein
MMARSSLRGRLDRAAARVGIGSENPLKLLTDAELAALTEVVKARVAGEPEPGLPVNVEAERIERVFADICVYGKAGNKS